MASSAKGVVRSIVERLATTGRAFHALDRPPPQGEDFVRRLLRNLPGMAYRCRIDRHWTMEFVSSGCRDLTGFEPRDLIDNRVVSFAHLIHPDDRQWVWDTVQDAVDRGASFQLTYRIRRVDGKERRVWEQGCAVVGEGGAVEAIEGFITDVTEHADLAARDADREGQFRALVEQSLVGVYVVRAGRLQYVNPRLGEIFGYTPDEMRALPSILALVHPEDHELVASNVRRRLEGEITEVRYEFRGIRRDGAELEVEVHGRRVDLEGAPAIIGTLLDVTGRKRTQRRYHEMEKMNALGRLAGGVAHDLNNFLALIKTTAELVALERPGDDAIQRDMGEIAAATARGAALSRQLTHFGRSRPGLTSSASLESLLQDLQPGLERLVGSDIALRVTLEPDLPAVALDPTHADEVLMNLVLNARDATSHHGTIGVTARRHFEPSRAPKAGPGRAEHVVIEVTDDGVGIPPENVKHIFEPYFTTKGDTGTGLGLANVWRIVTDAGGAVEVDSDPGAGSTFRVYLPIAHTT